ncbi:MAG: ComEC/Rec2 family competence protein [Dethiobacteria bacterium]|jgi:competence protein ComEC
MQKKIYRAGVAVKKYLPVIFTLLLLLVFWSGGCSSSLFSEPGASPGTGIFPAAATDSLTVHFIDVGQGDAIFIQAPEKNILIDGGERNSNVAAYLQDLGIDSLDLVLSTHPHNDHIGGLLDVLENIPVQEVIDPGVIHTTKTFEDYLTLIDAQEIKFTIGRPGLTRELGDGIIMQILHPAAPSASHLNDASLITKITFDKISFLFTGDAEENSEGQMLRSNCRLQSTILKIGHHGSSSSTSPPFLKAVNPECAIIMVGAENKYAHPHEETLQTLTAAGVNIYRTDIHGTITITTDGQTYHLSLEKE